MVENQLGLCSQEQRVSVMCNLSLIMVALHNSRSSTIFIESWTCNLFNRLSKVLKVLKSFGENWRSVVFSPMNEPTGIEFISSLLGHLVIFVHECLGLYLLTT